MSIHSERRGPGKTPGHVYAYRWLSGHSMDGRHRTDATWFYRGTRAIREHERPMHWHYLPRSHRAGYRIAASAVTLAILYGYFNARTLTEDMTLGALAALFVAGIGYARYRIMHARHHHTVVKPLWQITAHITGSDSALPHQITEIHKRYIHVPRDYRNNPNTRIRLTVPVTWEAQKASTTRLQAIVSKRLGREFDIIPHVTDYPPYVEFVPAPSPPGSLTFADILPLIEKAKPSVITVGKGTHDTPITVDLDAEAPHIALAMGTGGGKSSTLRLFIIQLIRAGCERIDILDIKRASHTWAKGIPGVYIHTTMESMINAVAAFRKEMTDRYDILEHDDTAKFPRRALIVEEQNSLMAFARQYWSDFRNELPNEERNRVPKVCPLITDIGYALFMGRQSMMNVISVFQRMSATASGGGDMRDQYGCKILARFSPASWSILVGKRPVPRSSKIPGRARFVLGEDDRELQMAFITDADARAYALEHARPVSAESRDPLMTVPVGPDTGADDIPAMSLREMCEANLIPMRYSAAKRARTRAGDTFPAGRKTPAGIVYDPPDIQRFFTSRRK